VVEFKDFGVGLFNLLVGPAIAVFALCCSWLAFFGGLDLREDWLFKRHNRIRCEEEAAKK
jgi:hypothetical protein